MDSKTFTQRLSKNLGEDPRRVASMLEAFANVLRSSAQSLRDVAIPSFGTFRTTKIDEDIVVDRVSGRRMLLPPQIVVEFQPAAMLRKKISGSHE